MINKRKVTVYINEKNWLDFLRGVLDKRGKAAGGAISEEVENAIKMWLNKK